MRVNGVLRAGRERCEVRVGAGCVSPSVAGAVRVAGAAAMRTFLVNRLFLQ